MKDESFDFLQRLLNTSSPSGFEEGISQVWRNYLADFKPHGDVYGNAIASFNDGGSPKILLCGHIDEVGFMVNYVNDEGFIYVSTIGGVDPYIMPAQRVTIYNERGPVSGVVGRKPIHLLDEDEDNDIKIHNVFVDIGASDKEEALSLVAIGDPITFNAGITKLANNRVAARGLDDGVGAWCIAEVLKKLKEDGMNGDPCRAAVRAVATVQEENGFYGAHMGIKHMKPDLALAVDVAHSTDVPDISKEQWGDVKIGSGPVITVGSVVHKSVSNSLKKAADRCRISVQIQPEPQYTGTDADALFMEWGGIPTGIVGIPNRYMHSPVEVIQLTDLEDAVTLIVSWCKSV